LPSILESVMSAQSNSPPVNLRPAQSFATCTASVMLFAISMPRSGAVGGGFCCGAAVISRARPAFRRTPARLWIRKYTYAKKYSPEQIAGRLKVDFPDRPEMQVSTETIYQSLYVQSRGALKHELTRCLRTGRAVRRPSRKVGQRKNRIPNMINISELPAEADDRAVPGHWESQCCCQAVARAGSW